VNRNGRSHQSRIWNHHGFPLGAKKAKGRRNRERRPPIITKLQNGPFNFRGRERDSISFLQHLVRRTRLAVDANQIVAGLGRTDLLLE
jgi:hypothetical protein